MLKLVIDGYHVEFYKKEEDSIQFNFYNPLYNSTNAIGLPDGTYPFLIPASNNNKKFFGYPYRIGATKNMPSGTGGKNYQRSSGVKPLNKIWKGWLYLGGIPRTSVNVQFIYATEKEFSIQCVIGNAQLDAFMRNTKIKDFISGEAGTIAPNPRLKVAHLSFNLIGGATHPDSDNMTFGIVISHQTFSFSAYKRFQYDINYQGIADAINASSTAAKCTASYIPGSKDLVLTALGLTLDLRFDLSDVSKDTSSGVYQWFITSENVSPVDGNNVVMSTRKKQITVSLKTNYNQGAITGDTTPFVNNSGIENNFSVINRVLFFIDNKTYTANQNPATAGTYTQQIVNKINTDVTARFTAVFNAGNPSSMTITAKLAGCENAFDSSQVEARALTDYSGTDTVYFWRITDDFQWAKDYGDDIRTFLNNTLTAEPAPPYVFAPFSNPGFYDTSQNPDWLVNRIVNAYSVSDNTFLINYNSLIATNTLPGGFARTSSFHNFYTLVPMVRLSYVLQAIFAGLGIKVNSDFLNDAEIQSIVLYNNVSLDCGDTLKFTDTQQTINTGNPPNPNPLFLANLYVSNFNLSDHLPDITIANLLDSICSLFGLVKFYNFANNTIEIETINDYLSNERWDNKLKSPGLGKKWIGRKQNWTGSEDPYYELEPPDEFSFTLSQQGDSSDTNQPVNIYNVFANPLSVDNVKNTGPVTINTNLGTTAMGLFYVYQLSEFTHGRMLMPSVNQKGSSPLFNTGANSYGPRLLFYRGMQTDEGASTSSGTVYGSYPLLSADIYDAIGTIIANYSLYYPGQFGLYNVFYKAWINLRVNNGRQIRTIYLDAAQLARFAIGHKIFIRGHNYIIRSMKIAVSPTKSGKYPAKCELIRIRAS